MESVWKPYMKSNSTDDWTKLRDAAARKKVSILDVLVIRPLIIDIDIRSKTDLPNEQEVCIT